MWPSDRSFVTGSSWATDGFLCDCFFCGQVSRADILVVGAGRAEMVRGDWLKEGAVVIDCGINHISGDQSSRLCLRLFDPLSQRKRRS